MAGTGVFNWPAGGITWDPAHSGTNIVLSGSNLIATVTTSTAQTNTRCTVGKSSGKWYWEITISGGSTNGYNIGLLFGTTSANVLIGGATGVGSSYGFINFVGLGFKGTNGVFPAYGGSYNVIGTIVGVAFDATAGTIEMFINTGGGNVSQGVMYTGISGTYYPAVGDYNANTFQYTANFAGPFASTPPAGFIALTP